MDETFLFRTKKEYEQAMQQYIKEKQYQEALYYLETIAPFVVDSIWLNFTRGQLYNALEQYHLALPYFLKASQQVSESITLYSEIGWTYNRLEQFDEALSYLEKCIYLGREDQWIYSELAYTYLKLGMKEEGIVYLLEGLELKPDDRWTLEQLANAYSDLGHYIEANNMNKRLLELEMNETLLEDIITLNEINETMEDQYTYLQMLAEYPAHHAFVCYHFGVYYNLIEKYREASAMLEEIAENDRDGETWIELGYAYHQLFEIEEAIRSYERGYLLYPTHLFLLSELAYLYGLLEDYDKKLFYLDEAFLQGRRDLWIYLNYIRVYLYGKKDLEKAYYYLSQANTIASTDEELQKLWSEYDWFMLNKEMAQNRILSLLARRLNQAMPQSFYNASWNTDTGIVLDIPNLERVYQFSEGLAYVETNQHGGFIDQKGQLVIDLHLSIDETKRQDTYMFHHGYAIINQEGEHLYGLIDHQGNLILDLIYDDIKLYHDHQRLVLGPVTIFKFENQQYVFEEEAGDFAEGMVPIKKNGQWYYCDLNKETLLSQGFDEAQAFHEHMAIVKKGDYYGVIDLKGNLMIPFEYAALSWANHDLIAKKDDAYGVIDGQGKIKIEFIWEQLKDANQGYYRVLNKKGWGLISESGKPIIPCLYDELLPIFEDLVRVEKDSCYGMYSIYGELVIPIIYDTLTICKGQHIIAGVGYRYGYMNAKGELLTPFMFQTATLPVEHLLCVSFQNQFYLVDDRGKKE
ncbi:WG repeat-containing protein [Beduini massiliensis]|uniref:WG repeat-containing protein n=1 Tax=Beduini massiliensis TaxID=1585974 RepID=UPI00059A950C|nr:WG repeat-containing protein [Beduini massiliensis]